MPLKAVLFDFDGVLADTENFHIAAWQRTLAQIGIEPNDTLCLPAAETDDRKFLAEILAARGIHDADIAGWVARKQDLTRSLLADNPRLYPGVFELVNALAGKVRMAVVSGSWRENIQAVLTSAKLADAFEVIVAKEDFPTSKPDPEPYLLALSRLNVLPNEAVAIEDSASGVASAVGAGIRTIAVGHRHASGEWCANAEFVSDLASRHRELDWILGV